MFRKWSKIEQFHNVVRDVNRLYNPPYPKMLYRPKIKLHGTNAAVSVIKGVVRAQKRTNFIDSSNDNFGFATWVEKTNEVWKNIPSDVGEDIIVYGEWIGPGIQKGVALSNIPKKVFAIFAIVFPMEPELIVVEPEEIETVIQNHGRDDIKIIPWHMENIEVNFMNIDDMNNTLNRINDVVENIGNECPWTLDNFNVSGPGEGLVFYPDPTKFSIEKYNDVFSQYTFKAKSEKHRQVKQKNATQIDPEKIRKNSEFAEKFVTDARVEQAIQEGTNGSLSMKQIGPFLAWIGRDIKEESKDELEANNLDWKDAQKEVRRVAVQKYKEISFGEFMKS